MKKPIIPACAFGMLFCLICNYCFAQQQTRADSAADGSAEKYTINLFNRSVGQQSQLYNGAEYPPYNPIFKSNPYLNEVNEWRPGSVIFNGFNYDNVPLRYDLYKDALVTLLHNKFSWYVLASERVSSFRLMGHNFKYISADTVKHGAGSGFYEVFYSGKVQGVAKYSKHLQTSAINTTEINTYFTAAKKEYYVIKNNVSFQIGSEHALLNALKDHKKELQQYIKANSIRFEKQPEQAMAMITSYYDHL